MRRLSHKEYGRLNQAVLQLYEPVSPDHLPNRIIEVLESALPNDFVALCTHDVSNDTGDAFMSQPTHGFLVDFVENLDDFHQLPGVKTGEYFNAPDAFSLMDFMSVDRFKHCALYECFYEPADILHHLNLNLSRQANLQLQINVSRRLRPYSDTERFMLNMLKPHLAARFQSMAREYEQHPIFGKASLIQQQTWLLCTSNGRLLDRSDNANQALAKVGEIVGPDLPTEWLTWLAACIERSDAVNSIKPLTLHKGKACINIHCLPNPRSGEHRLVLESRTRKKTILSPREMEVLVWIRRGLTNSEIAARLGISTGTVKIHVEHILSKLDVPNRHAAAVVQLE